jgi:hypothetical protein
LQILTSLIRGKFPAVVYWGVLPLIPFIIAEQPRPFGEAPRGRDYAMNILISRPTAYLSLPRGIAAGPWSSLWRHLLPWKPRCFTFHTIGALPIVGPGLEILAMIFFPLFPHEFGFYRTYDRPVGEGFPATGLGPDSPAPRSLLSAQFAPLVAVGRLLRRANREGANTCSCWRPIFFGRGGLIAVIKGVGTPGNHRERATRN